ncbi:MAG TPA: SRPBCC family protein [Methylocystis sp.]|nr:SRPBCC family protein [Methylocystis sp.]
MIWNAHVSKTMSAPSELVWAALRTGDGLERWFSLIDSCRLDGDGVGAVRTLTTAGGVMNDRIIEISNEDRRFRYRRFEWAFPTEDYIGTVEVRDAGEGRALVLWTACAEAPDDQAQALTAILQNAFGSSDFVAVIENVLRDGLDGLERELTSEGAGR